MAYQRYERLKPLKSQCPFEIYASDPDKALPPRVLFISQHCLEALVFRRQAVHPALACSEQGPCTGSGISAQQLEQGRIIGRTLAHGLAQLVERLFHSMPPSAMFAAIKKKERAGNQVPVRSA